MSDTGPWSFGYRTIGPLVLVIVGQRPADAEWRGRGAGAGAGELVDYFALICPVFVFLLPLSGETAWPDYNAFDWAVD